MSYDTIIVGGSFAVLPAALLSRLTGTPIQVLDTGMPRNRFAAPEMRKYKL